ncbi:MAG: hypothetical protein MRZ98_09795 [Clostridiales bacterium]|nr:hypothetical protein [Clostridiales bacterium]
MQELLAASPESRRLFDGLSPTLREMLMQQRQDVRTHQELEQAAAAFRRQEQNQ